MYQQNNPDRDNPAEIWRNAQHRRAEDIGVWFRHFFEKRPQLESTGPQPRYFPQGQGTARKLKTGHSV